MNEQRPAERVYAWLEMLRLPNAPTVPGDPLVGALLMLPAGAALGVPAFWAAGASLLLYAAGLLFNDVADVEVDRRERPFRPLPSGRIGVGAARGVAWLILAAGVAAAGLAGRAALVVGALLAGLILAYNFRLKKHPVFGPASMGLCRGASVLLGAAAVGRGAGPSEGVQVAAFTATAYILAVSVLARYEMRSTGSAPLAHGPWGVIVLGAAVSWGVGGAPLWTLGLAVAAGFCAWRVDRRWRRAPVRERPALVGRLIQTWMLMQVFWTAGAPSPDGRAVALALVLGWALIPLLRRFFYAS